MTRVQNKDSDGAQAGQNLYNPHDDTMGPNLPTEYTANGAAALTV